MVNYSGPEREVYDLIRQVYPHYKLKKEYVIKYKGKNLRFDFYLPELGLIIEVHGTQHFKFVKHFHQDSLGFNRSLKRDSMKRQWCVENGKALVEINSCDLPLLVSDFISMVSKAYLDES